MKFSLMIPVLIRASDKIRAEMLVQCLESILAQKYQDWEVVLKDARPQEPVTLHKKVQDAINALGPRINYVAMADKNIPEGINQALWWASGDILHLTCGDDLIGDSDTLSYVNERFEQAADCDNWNQTQPPQPCWLYGSTGCVNEDGSEGPWGIQPWATLEEILIHNRMGCMATYWNRAMFNRLGYMDTQYLYAHDYDYWCRCYRIAVPMYTTRVLGVGRRWNQSITQIESATVEHEAFEISLRHSGEQAAYQTPVYVPYRP